MSPSAFPISFPQTQVLLTFFNASCLPMTTVRSKLPSSLIFKGRLPLSPTFSSRPLLYSQPWQPFSLSSSPCYHPHAHVSCVALAVRPFHPLPLSPAATLTIIERWVRETKTLGGFWMPDPWHEMWSGVWWAIRRGEGGGGGGFDSYTIHWSDLLIPFTGSCDGPSCMRMWACLLFGND